jgi:hypothetical protein
MSHVRRVVGLILIALMGWFLAAGTAGAATTSVSAAKPTPPIECC